MLKNIISLTKKLVAIRSDPGNTKELNQALNLVVSQVDKHTVEHFEHNGSRSVLVYNTPTRPKKFKVILNGHLDVIPGKQHQYTPKIQSNRLYGVGTMDMKSNVACLVTAFHSVANKINYPLGLQLVTDEETGGFNGTKYQIEQGVRANFVIAGETTNFNIAHKSKGILWIKIATTGKTAHGAYPWKGENAIWKINHFLNHLKKLYPIPKEQQWITTVNLSSIETSNKSFNKIPDDCVVSLDIRYIPEDVDSVVSHIKKLLPPESSLEIVVKEPALFVAENNEYIQALLKITQQVTRGKVTLYGAQGSSDARHYSDIKCPGVEFGPIGGGIGTDEEWVDIKSLETYTNVLKQFLLSL